MINRFDGVINKKSINNVIHDNMLEYSGYIAKDRAIPALEDGLKPVYRRILITMNNMKANSFTKSQNITGQVMRVHPHGDSYPTMVGMVQKDNHLTPLIDGKGNFSQHTSRDLAPAAARYSEAKLSDLSKEIFKDLNKDIVSWVPNYDGTLQIPSLLPVKFPMVLHIAQEGIAVGLSSKTPSFNINDICTSMIKYLQANEKNILIPDFATGGKIIIDEEAFKKINFEGKGTVKIRGKAEINNNIITITEIPYSTTREKIIDTIIKLVKDKKLPEITSIKDLTGLNGMKIEIVCKRNTDMELILEKLYHMTTLEDTYSCNMNVLDNGLPRTLGVWDIIDKWLDWRHGCLIKQKLGENSKILDELELLLGFKNVINRIDELIETIRNSDENIIENIRSKFNMSYRQAEYIVNMKFKNINKIYIQNKIDKISKLEYMLDENDRFISDRNIRNYQIIADLKEVSEKFGRDRMTEIVSVTKNQIKIAKEKAKKDMDNFDVTVYITEEGYIKKTTSNSGEQKLKPGDKIKHEFHIKNSDEIVVFIGTDAYKIYAANLDVVKKSDFGQYIPTILGVGDEIIGYSVVSDKYKFILISYDNGKIAKVDLESFKTSTNRKKLSNSLYGGAKVLNILTFEEDKDITIVQTINKKDKETVINTKDMVLKALRSTQGVNVLRNTKYIKV